MRCVHHLLIRWSYISTVSKWHKYAHAYMHTCTHTHTCTCTCTHTHTHTHHTHTHTHAHAHTHTLLIEIAFQLAIGNLIKENIFIIHYVADCRLSVSPLSTEKRGTMPSYFKCHHTHIRAMSTHTEVHVYAHTLTTLQAFCTPVQQRLKWWPVQLPSHRLLGLSS